MFLYLVVSSVVIASLLEDPPRLRLCFSARILYAQHAAPALQENTGTRVGAAWLPERDGGEAALDQKPEELSGGRGPESGGGCGWGRRWRRSVSRRRRGDGHGGENTESD